jgi:hypothetical protein
MGQELVRREGLICLALLLAACQEAKVVEHKVAATVAPQMQATVITLQTSLQPQNRTFTHTITIANGRARSSDEIDRWRLFDLDRGTISYVDDLAKEYYTIPVPKAAAAPPLVATGEKRPILGVEANQYVLRFGGLQRELWMGAPASIPPNLFAMMHADDSRLAALPGFALVDHSELPFGKSKMVVEHSVIGIDQRNVPQSTLNIPADYKEITAPGANRPPASSPPHDQSTRGAG